MANNNRSVEVVIGAGYGDEGKGVLTDALACRDGERATVVRFNGGAQAGHTVTLRDGRRHVFHHVGSGALAGAATYLSRFFVANPIVLRRELEDLARLGITPRIAIDPAAPVTTPYDMMVNQIIERSRGLSRHGSCGLGFGETLERDLRPEFGLTVAHTSNRDVLRARLLRIRRDWVPMRLRGLGVWPIPPEEQSHLISDALVERWLDDVAAFHSAVEIAAISSLNEARHLVFEGAQGLMLDQDRGAFPYVTRSNTGLKNVLTLASELDLHRLEVTYVSRAYTTRHGAGPLAHELSAAPFPAVIDSTNVPNPWQGALRYGTLDLDVLKAAVSADLALAQNGRHSIVPRLAVTCLDQVGENTEYFSAGHRHVASPDALAAAATDAVGASSLVYGRGPTRQDLHGL
jgi:adenylosuccinate synthase